MSTTSTTIGSSTGVKQSGRSTIGRTAIAGGQGDGKQSTAGVVDTK